jgi:hypothetical protein
MPGVRDGSVNVRAGVPASAGTALAGVLVTSTSATAAAWADYNKAPKLRRGYREASFLKQINLWERERTPSSLPVQFSQPFAVA